LSQITLFGNLRLFADDTALLYSEREFAVNGIHLF
jgi:hypothetical protein